MKKKLIVIIEASKVKVGIVEEAEITSISFVKKLMEVVLEIAIKEKLEIEFINREEE